MMERYWENADPIIVKTMNAQDNAQVEHKKSNAEEGGLTRLTPKIKCEIAQSESEGLREEMEKMFGETEREAEKIRCLLR